MTPSDVRMRGFAERADVEEVERFLAREAQPLAAEAVPVTACSGRVLAVDVRSDVDVPGFARSAMDGFAVRGEATFGASGYDPIELRLVGIALPGRPFEGRVGAEEAVRIMTGAPLPAGADAVVMAEVAREEGGRVVVREPVAPHRNVGAIGEDIRAGEVVLRAGRRLRPQDAGLLASIGVGEVPCVRRPRVALVVTGDELLPPGAKPDGPRIVDSNSVVLRALVARDGGEALPFAILPDDAEAVRAALQAAVGQEVGSWRPSAVAAAPSGAEGHAADTREAPPRGADVVLVSGGSSVGQEDHAPRLVAELGSLDFHGVAMRPSSPAGVGRLWRGSRQQGEGGVRSSREREAAAAADGGAFPRDGRAPVFVFLLPGNPVSCLCAYEFFAGPTLRVLGGRSRAWPHRRVRLPLARKISSAVGRTDYVRVAIEAGRVLPLSTSGASILSSTVRAAGFVIVPRELEGLPGGAEVEVGLYDDEGIEARTEPTS